MHDTLTMLKAYQQRWPAEQQTVNRMISFVESDPGCYQRENPFGHFTAAAWLVDDAGDNVLLTHHRKLNKWLQLGGHADGNPNLHEVALQEAIEESGIAELTLIDHAIFDVDIHAIPAHGTIAEHFHFDVRFMCRAKHRQFNVSHESIDLAWVPIGEISTFTTEDSILRMADKWNRIKQHYNFP